MPAPALVWGERTWLMGVLNVTSDSFSGDGLMAEERSMDEVVEAAVAQARVFVDAGATLLDVGAESSRPAHSYGEHPAISAKDEAARAVPVVAALHRAFGERAVISIDTTKGSVARAALGAGASMVNDVWAGLRDPDTLRAAADHGGWLVVMHNRERPEYPRGVVAEVVAELAEAVERATRAGVRPDRLIVDPGIGFGKTPDQSLEVLHRLAEIRQALGRPILVGTSRKRFIGEALGGVPPAERVEGTAASVAVAIAAGADIVRVHDVEHIARTIRVADAIVRRPPSASPLAATVSLRRIHATGRHGVTDEERRRDQPFEVDVSVGGDLAAFGPDDDVARTVDYAELHELVLQQVAGEPAALIETVARRIGESILHRWTGAAMVEVRVRKLDPPMPGSVQPGAAIRLTRATLGT